MGVEVVVNMEMSFLQRFMDTLIERQRNLRPLLKRFQVHMTRSLALNFINEGRPKKWAKLKRSTTANRRMQSSAVLQDTGRLRMSVLVRTAPGNITKFTTNSLTMGTSLKQAGVLQFGTQSYTLRPRNRQVISFRTSSTTQVFAKFVNHPGLTPRPFVIIQDEDIIEMSKITAAYASGEDI